MKCEVAKKDYFVRGTGSCSWAPYIIIFLACGDIFSFIGKIFLVHRIVIIRASADIQTEPRRMFALDEQPVWPDQAESGRVEFE